MTATVNHPVPAPGSLTGRLLAWLRLGTVTAPLLVLFFAFAAIGDVILPVARAGRRRRDQGPKTPAGAPSAGSAILVPAEVWAQPGVSIRQDDEAAVNRR